MADTKKRSGSVSSIESPSSRPKDPHLCSKKKQSLNINLDNFDETDPIKPILTSPRSIEACNNFGILPEELIARPIEYFQERGLSADLLLRKFEHFERRRLEKLARVRRDYENQKITTPSQETQAAQATPFSLLGSGQASKPKAPQAASPLEAYQKELEELENKRNTLARRRQQVYIEKLKEKAQEEENLREKMIEMDEEERKRQQALLHQWKCTSGRQRVHTIVQSVEKKQQEDEANQRLRTIAHMMLDVEANDVNQLASWERTRLQHTSDVHTARLKQVAELERKADEERRASYQRAAEKELELLERDRQVQDNRHKYWREFVEQRQQKRLHRETRVLTANETLAKARDEKREKVIRRMQEEEEVRKQLSGKPLDAYDQRPPTAQHQRRWVQVRTAQQQLQDKRHQLLALHNERVDRVFAMAHEAQRKQIMSKSLDLRLSILTRQEEADRKERLRENDAERVREQLRRKAERVEERKRLFHQFLSQRSADNMRLMLHTEHTKSAILERRRPSSSPSVKSRQVQSTTNLSTASKPADPPAS